MIIRWSLGTWEVRHLLGSICGRGILGSCFGIGLDLFRRRSRGGGFPFLVGIAIHGRRGGFGGIGISGRSVLVRLCVGLGVGRRGLFCFRLALARFGLGGFGSRVSSGRRGGGSRSRSSLLVVSLSLGRRGRSRTGGFDLFLRNDLAVLETVNNLFIHKRNTSQWNGSGTNGMICYKAG